MSSLTLYHYWRSSASWRVRWALELKKVPHQKVAVDLLTGAEKNPEYLRKNPSGYVPCLVVGDQMLGESVAIIEWLEETYPQHPLLPGNSFERALIRRLVETVNSGIQPLQNLDVTKKISDDKEVQAEWTRHWIARGMGVYETILRESGSRGHFSVSDTPTMADLFLIPQCYATKRFGVDLAQFPKCQAIYEHALTTPECHASAPERFQPA